MICRCLFAAKIKSGGYSHCVFIIMYSMSPVCQFLRLANLLHCLQSAGESVRCFETISSRVRQYGLVLSKKNKNKELYRGNDFANNNQKKKRKNFPQIHTRLLNYTLSMSEKKQNKIICFLYVRFVKNPKSFFHSGNR